MWLKRRTEDSKNYVRVMVGVNTIMNKFIKDRYKY